MLNYFVGYMHLLGYPGNKQAFQVVINSKQYRLGYQVVPLSHRDTVCMWSVVDDIVTTYIMASHICFFTMTVAIHQMIHHKIYQKMLNATQLQENLRTLMVYFRVHYIYKYVGT